MRIMLVSLLLVAACGKKGPDPEIARLNGVIESLRREMADDRAAKEREIAALKSQLTEAQAAREAEAQGLRKSLDEVRAAAEAQIGDLQKGLAAKAKEAADALAKAVDFEKRWAGLGTQLTDAKAALQKRTADFDALKAELANLKKMLGR